MRITLSYTQNFPGFAPSRLPAKGRGVLSLSSSPLPLANSMAINGGIYSRHNT